MTLWPVAGQRVIILRVLHCLRNYSGLMTEKDVRILAHSDFAALSAELIENSSGLRFRAHGRSMLPTICSGDILTVEKVDPGRLRIGDIVLVQDGGTSAYVSILLSASVTSVSSLGLPTPQPCR